MTAWNKTVHGRVATAMKDARRSQYTPVDHAAERIAVRAQESAAAGDRYRVSQSPAARTQIELADATSRLGYPVTSSQIANYESGRKHTLDITELMMLAAALNVPALSLLFPGLPNAPVEVLPGQSATTAQAKEAFVGDRGLLWPGNELSALREQLGRIEAAMGGMAGMGALTALGTAIQKR